MGGCRGASLVELMIGIVVASIAMIFIGQFFESSRRAMVSGSVNESVEANLRGAMRMMSDAVRGAGFGVPSSSWPAWIPWTTYSGNPTIVAGAGPAVPDSVTVAACSQPLSTLSAAVPANATTLTLVDDVSASLNAGSKSLLLVNGTDNVVVTAVAANVVSIDADPTTAGAQGTVRGYTAGTPVCRVDVLTYDVDTTHQLLRVDYHDGNGPQPVLDNIANLKITPTAPGLRQYQLTLTAQSSQNDPLIWAPIQRSLSAEVTQRN